MGKWWEQNVAETIKGWNERQLVITSHPPRADVFVNDVYQGKTPLRLSFKAHVRDMFKGFTVSVRKERYLPLTRAVSFRAGRVAFRLIKKQGRRK